MTCRHDRALNLLSHFLGNACLLEFAPSTISTIPLRREEPRESFFVFFNLRRDGL